MNEFYASRCWPTNSDLMPLSSTASVNYSKIFFLSCCGFQQLKEELLAGGSWDAQDAAHGASDNELVIRGGLEPREPSRTPLDRSCLLSPARPTVGLFGFLSNQNCTTERPGIRRKSRRLTVNTE